LNQKTLEFYFDFPIQVATYTQASMPTALNKTY